MRVWVGMGMVMGMVMEWRVEDKSGERVGRE
jgi:hypothetical protein